MTFWSADLLAWLQLIPCLLVPVLFLKNASAVACCCWARRLRVLQLAWLSMLWALRSLSDRSREAAAEAAHSPRAGGWSYWSAHLRWEFPQPREAVPQGQVFRCFGVHWAAIWHEQTHRAYRARVDAEFCLFIMALTANDVTREPDICQGIWNQLIVLTLFYFEVSFVSCVLVKQTKQLKH